MYIENSLVCLRDGWELRQTKCHPVLICKNENKNSPNTPCPALLPVEEKIVV